MIRIQLTFKTPDVVEDALLDAFPKRKPNYKTDEWEALSEEEEQERQDKMRAVRTVLAKWIRYGEYCTIDIDVDQQTAVVLPAE